MLELTLALGVVVAILFLPLAPLLASKRLEVRRRRPGGVEPSWYPPELEQAAACEPAGPYRTSSRPTDDVAGPADHALGRVWK